MKKPISAVNSNTDYLDEYFNANSEVAKPLTEVTFGKCKFVDVNFSEVRLIRCRFEECEFQGCNFNMARFVESKVLESKFLACRLTGVDWMQIDTSMGFSLNCESCELSYCVFSGVDLSKSVFIKCKIHDAEFSDAILRETVFEESDLLGTFFTRCDMGNANFKKATNYVFDLRDNKCKKTIFSRPEVENLLLPFDLVVAN